MSQPKPPPATSWIVALLFRLGEKWFALPANAVLLVAEPRRVRAVPHRPVGVFRGLVNLTGVRPCVSLHEILDSPAATQPKDGATARPRMIAIGEQDRSWVFVADEVHSVLQIERSRVEDATQREAAPFTTARIPWRDHAVRLLDPDLLLAGLTRVVQ